jgi:hypothetical protein
MRLRLSAMQMITNANAAENTRSADYTLPHCKRIAGG